MIPFSALDVAGFVCVVLRFQGVLNKTKVSSSHVVIVVLVPPRKYKRDPDGWVKRQQEMPDQGASQLSICHVPAGLCQTHSALKDRYKMMHSPH